MEFDPDKLYLVRGRSLVFVAKLIDRLFDIRYGLQADDRQDMAGTLYDYLDDDVQEYQPPNPKP